MDKIKRLYHTIETYLSNKPIGTALLFAIVGSVLPVTITSDIKSLLSRNYQLPGYLMYVAFFIQLFTIGITFYFFRQRNVRSRLIKRINAILSKLDSPFVQQSETLLGKQIINERFYDYEMIKSFKEYNDILAQVKLKWDKEFKDLEPLTNKKRIHQGDWIPESELNGVKVSLLQLRKRIDEN